MTAPWHSSDMTFEKGTPPWDWLGPAYAAFVSRLAETKPAYPCYFGVRGQLEGNNWFAAMDDRMPDEFGIERLVASLLAFQWRAWQGPKRQSLIVFVGPPRPATLCEERDRYWSLLSQLRTHDPQDWPEQIPRDPDDSAWQWCFAGEPWFTFLCSPAYRRRRSRNVGPCLTVVFQTRRVFDGLSGSTLAGRSAKARVRANLLAYDAVPPHRYLGDAGSSSAYKWRQYALPDEEGEGAASCPFPREGSR